MKSIKFILAIFAVSLMISCNDGGQLVGNKKSEIFNDLSVNQLNSLQRTLSHRLSDNNVDVSKILNIRKFDNIHIVTILSDGKKRRLGLKSYLKKMVKH